MRLLHLLQKLNSQEFNKEVLRHSALIVSRLHQGFRGTYGLIRQNLNGTGTGTGTGNRVATAQGKHGIWFLLFPDRENTGNFAVTQGKI